MKKEKACILVAIFAVVLGITLVTSAANAAQYDCVGCSITAVGVNTSTNALVKIDDPANKWTGARRFYLHDNIAKTGLATVLTAVSLGKTVRVRVHDTVAGSWIIIVNLDN